jgi:hypothetical protein
MTTYPHDWPEWAKQAAFDVDIMTTYFRRGTSEHLRDKPDERGMIGEIIYRPNDRSGEDVVANHKGQPITRDQAMERYAKTRPGPSVAEMQAWARNECQAVQRVRAARTGGGQPARPIAYRKNEQPLAQAIGETRGDWE